MTIKRKVIKFPKVLPPKRRIPWVFYGVLGLAFVLAVMGGMLAAPFVIPHVPYLKQIEGYKSPMVFQYQMDCSSFFKEHLI